ncbi:MAG: SAM hydrolase/SAM-dependent halogenase family protein [Candidatus Caldatribacteriaceae bacterium]
MAYIVLLTDWGQKSYYAGVIKGVILKINPQAQIIDLTHEIEPYNVREAMYILDRAYREFPHGSIFLSVVDYGVGTERKAIAFQTESGYFFVGPDNGIFTLVQERENISSIVELNRPQYFYVPQPSFTFHGRDIFAPASAHLSQGIPLEVIGTPLGKISSLSYHRAQICGNTIEGEIAFFDRFGNIQTNIPASLAEKAGFRGQEVWLCFSRHRYRLRYTETYGREKRGTLLIHPDSSNFLEIAVNQGCARDILAVQPGMKIRLRKASQKLPPELDTLL